MWIHADDVVEVAFVDGVARVRRRAEDRAQLVRRRADRDAGDPHARHHHLAGGQLAELEQLLQHLARLRAERPLLLGFLDDSCSSSDV